MTAPPPLAPARSRRLAPLSSAAGPPVAAVRTALRGGLGQNVWSLADQGALSATRLLLSVLVGRTLGADGLGVYALALTVVYLVEGVVETLATLPYTVLRHRTDGARAYAGSTLAVTATVGVGLGAVVAAAACALNPPLQTALLVLSLALPARALAEGARRLSFAHSEAGVAFAVNLCLVVVLGGGAALAASVGRLSVPLVVGLYGVGSALPAAVWLATAGRRHARWVPARMAEDARRSWTFGRWVLGTRLAVMGRAHGLYWVLGAAVGAAEVGLFDAGGKVIGLAVPVLVSVSNVLTPRVARAMEAGGPLRVRRVVLATTAGMVAVTTVLGTVLTLGADVALGVLFGPAFAGNQVLVGALALALALESAGIAADAGLWAIERPRAGFWIALGGLAVLGLAASVLVPAYGATGGAGALVLATGVTAAVQLGTFLRLSARARPDVDSRAER